MKSKNLLLIGIILLIGFAIAFVTVNLLVQTPANINTTNLYQNGLNITYNITSSTSVINASNVTLYYKTNSTLNNIQYFVNGTSYSGYFKTTGTNQSNNWTFTFSDDDIFPGTWNLNQSQFSNSVHSYTTLIKDGALKVEFLNVSNSTPYNIIHFMANSSTSALPLDILYCNSTYTSGDLSKGNANCIHFATVSPTQNFTITEPQLNQSKYQYAGLYINTTSGLAENVVKVTPTSSIIFLNPDGQTWYIYNVPTISRTGATQYSVKNGATWVSQSYTTDAHLQQFDGNIFYHYACASDNSGNSSCSTIHSDAISLNDIPPSPPDITSPLNQTYNGIINITYNASISPVGNQIISYNISLLNTDESYNKTIVSVAATSYSWETSTVPDGSYRIKVTAKDNQSLTSFDISPIFTIKNQIAPTPAAGGSSAQIPEIEIKKLFNETPSCPTSAGILSPSFPWWGTGVFVGSISCDSINTQKWFFNFRETNGYYSFIGVRIYLIVAFALLIFIAFKIRDIGRLLRRFRQHK